jgi:hypothetical protein
MIILSYTSPRLEVGMSLKGPNNEDVRKIHAESNQIVNQRFLITTFAITVFGVIGAWLIPKNTPAAGSDLGAFTFAGSILLISLLFILFLFNHFLRGMLRIYTTYLLATNKSDWEHDWERYRKEKYLGYTKAQTIVFLALGILSTVYPVILAEVYSLNITSQSGFWANIIVGVVYFILVIAMGFEGLWDPESKARERWQKLKGGENS